jgi:protoporphyrinogen oxidase
MEQKHGSIVLSIFKRTRENTTLLDGSQKSPFVLKNEKALSVSFRNGMGSLINALNTKIEVI